MSSQDPDDRNLHQDEPFLTGILKPGSSLHPTFLLIVDSAFLFLLIVFVILAFLTSGNPHIFALMAVELGLWGSVKWFVNELRKTPIDFEGERDAGKVKEE